MRHLQVAYLPGPRKRPGRRFERLMTKAPGFAGGYLLITHSSNGFRIVVEDSLLDLRFETMHLRQDLVSGNHQTLARVPRIDSNS